MCRKSRCECGKWSWVGCGQHIESALNGIPLADRCAGWKTGKCPDNAAVMGPTGASVEANSPPQITEAMIEAKLRASIADVEFVSVVDQGDGCGSKFTVTVVSTAFEGVNIVARHRLVNGSRGALAEEMKYIHALSIIAWTPKEYAKKMAKK